MVVLLVPKENIQHTSAPLNGIWFHRVLELMEFHYRVVMGNFLSNMHIALAFLVFLVS